MTLGLCANYDSTKKKRALQLKSYFIIIGRTLNRNSRFLEEIGITVFYLSI